MEPWHIFLAVIGIILNFGIYFDPGVTRSDNRLIRLLYLIALFIPFGIIIGFAIIVAGAIILNGLALLLSELIYIVTGKKCE